MNLSAHGRAEVLVVLGQAQELGVTMRELLEFWKSKRKSIVNGVPITLGQVVNETIRTARTRNLRLSYTDSLEYELNRFADGRKQVAFTAISLADIEAWLASQTGRNGKAAPSTIQGIRMRLSAMFSEAVRKQYILAEENPMQRVMAPKVDPSEIVFLKPKEAHDLLHVCRVIDPRFLPWLVIGMFAGIRPEELERLAWRDIDIDAGIIVISEIVSKVRQRRLVEMEPLLIEWLRFIGPKSGYIIPVDGDRRDRWVLRNAKSWARYHRRMLYERAGVKSAPDILRKTAATYLMAKHANENKIAILLGNSPKILYRHYRGLVRREENDAFWANTPAKVKTDPIELPKGGKLPGDGEYGKSRPGKLIP
jgi:integrase